jgi:nitrite reductase (NADH) small subunit
MTVMVDDRVVWTDIGPVTDVPLRGARRVAAVGGAVAVFRTGDGRVFALVDACPHKGGPLSQGIVHGHAVACPLHNWQIDLATGEALGADRGAGCARTLPVQVRDGRLLLGRPARA